MKFALLGLVAVALVPAAASAQSAETPLGITRHQLEDADLLDARGREIGEVEALVAGPDGKVTGLMVEIDQRDPKPDHRVQIPLTGLKAVADRGDPGEFNIQTTKTATELLALPAAR